MTRQIDTRAVLRWRFVLLAVWGALLAVPSFRMGHAEHDMDWYVLRGAGRMLLGLDPGGLHLYAQYPYVQVGPPAVAINGAAQWAFGDHGDAAIAGLIIVLAMVTAWALEGVAALTWSRQAAQLAAFVAGLLLVVPWAGDFGMSGHFEDALALASIAVAARCVGQGRWLPAALMIGFAVGCKPWAVAAAPVLFGLRRCRLRALAAAALVAVVPWLPFLIADGQTLQVGRHWWAVVDGSGLHALGVPVGPRSPEWVRPVQFGVGFAVASVVAFRWWVAAPLAGIAVKVAVDPLTWAYYGVAPLVAAALVDVHRGRRFAAWTVSVLAVEYVIGPYAPATVAGYARVVWAVATIGLLAGRVGPGETRRRQAPEPLVGTEQDRLGVTVR